MLSGYRFSCRPYILLLSLCFLLPTLDAQPRRKVIEVVVTPEAPAWTYALGEAVSFTVQILKDGQALPGSEISYSIGPEQMPATQKGELLLKKGSTTLKAKGLEAAGFLRCEVQTIWQGHTYRGWGTAAFAPEQIQPVTELPADFDAFWSAAKAELAAIPMGPLMTLMPEYCTPEINVYHVRLNNIKQSWQGHSYFYGMLSVPAKPGKYPAILAVPGAGVRPYYRDDRAAEGLIVFRVGIHGFPVNLAPSIYQDLGKGALAQYHHNKLDDRDSYYYKRVFLGCVRAVDFIYSLSQFDGENLAVNGGSQGGALSIITAGLDNRIKYLAAFYPAMSDMQGYLAGQAGGWPHMFKQYDAAAHPAWVSVTPYYDVVNFARKLDIPGWYSWGFNDNVCPPTSMYAAYNIITAPKELHLFRETAHWTYPEQKEGCHAWLMKQLKGE